MSKVSIVIPIYNVEMYLEECLGSVTRQTLQDIEIVCVNDGSTDNSLEIIKRYAERDPRIVLIDKKNGGYGHAMNKGLEAATGEYIGIVEPDDFVPANMYENLYSKAKEHDLDFVKADFYRFTRNEQGDLNLKYNHLTDKIEYYNLVFNPSQDPETLHFKMNTWSGIYKNSFLQKYHIRHNESPGASFQDNGFYFQTFAYASRAMILDSPYYMCRRDNPNSSVNDPHKVYCLNAEYDYIRSLLARDQEIWDQFKGMYWYKKYVNYWNAVRYRIADEYKLEYLRRFAAEFKRGFATHEIDETLYTKRQWTNLQLIIDNPDSVYKKEEKRVYGDPRVLRQKLTESQAKYKKLAKKYKKLKSSNSFRLGYGILTPARAIRRKMRKKD